MIFILTSSLNLIFTRTIHSYQLNQINVSLNMVQPMKYRIYNLKLVKRTQKKICAVDKSTADKKWILDRTLSETSYNYHWHLRMFAHTIWTIHIVVCDELFIGTCRNVCDCMCVCGSECMRVETKVQRLTMRFGKETVCVWMLTRICIQTEAAHKCFVGNFHVRVANKYWNFFRICHCFL